jgi:hypothetical protein
MKHFSFTLSVEYRHRRQNGSLECPDTRTSGFCVLPGRDSGGRCRCQPPGSAETASARMAETIGRPDAVSDQGLHALRGRVLLEAVTVERLALEVLRGLGRARYAASASGRAHTIKR